jgi:Zn-ribbon protein, possibly nucleic acid-binding
MAKKINPQDMTVEEKLKALYQLQTIYTEIDKIKTLRGELPLEVQDLEDEIAGLQTRVSNFQTDLNTMKSADNEYRRTIDKSQALVEKYTKDLDNVRNNREFDSLNKEIEYQTLEIDLANKRLREGAAKQRICLDEIEKIRAIIADKELMLEEKKSELDDIISETRQKEEELRDQAKKKELMIEPRLLMSYKRIRKNSRNGLGIVYVQRDACGGCFNKIPPQRQLDIKMRKKVIVCEYCGRIMIDPELAGVKIVVPDEKPKKKRTIRRKKAEDDAPKAVD